MAISITENLEKIINLFILFVKKYKLMFEKIKKSIVSYTLFYLKKLDRLIQQQLLLILQQLHRDVIG